MLCKEIRLRAKEYGNFYKVISIYFGGGTPSELEQGEMTRIVLEIKNNFKVVKDAEITLECNPDNITEDKLREYKLIGVNRISIGGQSLNDKVLSFIGRRHNSKQLKNAIKLVKKCGFDNINVDMMIGLPYQTLSDVKKMARYLIKSKIKHISCYSLILEEGTKLFNMSLEQNIPFPTEDETIDMYNAVYSLLNKAGIKRYEVSNFALPDYECKHNLNYWSVGEYLGFGLSSHSYMEETRFNNTEDFDLYIENLRDDIIPVVSKEKLTLQMRKEETIMLGLRTKYGISIEDLDYNFGTHIVRDKKDEIEFLCSHGFISLRNGRIKVCENAYYVLDSIVLKLL